MRRIVNRKIYDTATATVIATDRYWDGSNFERNGRNKTLYRTGKNAYFVVNTTCWQGERDTLEPLSVQEAILCYEELPEQTVSFEDAFPGIKVEEA